MPSLPHEPTAEDLSADELSLSDIELEPIETVVNQVVADSPETEETVSPEQRLMDADGQSGLESEVSFFRREANVFGDRLPEHAAVMWLETAAAAEREGKPASVISEAVDEATRLRPDTGWVLSLARRLLIRHGHYQRTLELCQKEAKLGGDSANRVAVLIEAATLLVFHRGDLQAALDHLKEALKIDQSLVAALWGAVPLQLELELFEDAAVSLTKLGSILSVMTERSLYLYAAAVVRETRLKETGRAEALYRRALEADPDNLPALLALGFLYEREKNWSRLCSCLQQQAELIEDPDCKGRLLLQAGSLYLDRTGDAEAASAALRAASTAVPSWPAVWRRLSDVYEAEGRDQELVTVLRRLLDLTLDNQSRAALASHIGWLLETRLGQLDDAVECYRSALKDLPGYLPALQALRLIFGQLRDFENLLHVFASETEGALPAPVRAVFCVEMGDLLARELSQPGEAAVAYRRALALDPEFFLAFLRLQGVLKQLGAWPDLVEVLGQAIDRSQDESTRTAFQLKVAQTLAGPLSNRAEAAQAFQKVTAGDVSVVVGHELLELYERSSEPAALVPCLLELAEKTSFAVESQSYRLLAGSILEHQLDEPERALNLCSAVLRENHRNAAAVRAVERLYLRLGRLDDLVRLYLHQLKMDPKRSDAPALLCRVGHLLDRELSRPTEAIEFYSRALARSPTYVPALAALEQTVRSQRKWGELVKVLLRYAEARVPQPAVAEVLCRAAEVTHCHLNDLHGAANLYDKAWEIAPAVRIAPYGLARVLRAQGKWSEVLGLLDELATSATSDEERGLLAFDRARTKEHFLFEPPQVELYREAMGAFATGDRLRADITRALRRDLSVEYASWLLEQGRAASDTNLAVAQLLECAAFSEHVPDVELKPIDAAAEAYKRKPEQSNTVWAMERALFARQSWADLGRVREAEALRERKPNVRATKLGAAATAFLAAEAWDEARRVAEACLDVDKKCLVALRVLARLARKDRDYEGWVLVSERIAEGCEHPRNRLEWRLEAADLCSDKLDDVERALVNLNAVLGRNPAQTEAFDRALALLSKVGDVKGLARLYRRRIAAERDPSSRADLLRRYARLLRDEFEDFAGAAAEYARLLAINPADVEALVERADLLVRLEQWFEAAATLETLVVLSVDPGERYRALTKQADIWLHHVPEPERARAVLTTVLHEFPADPAATKMMIELHRNEGNWRQACLLLEEVAERNDPAARVWAKLYLAEVALLGLRDDDLRRRYERDALVAATQNYDAMPTVVAHYREANNLAQLGEVAAQVLADGAVVGEVSPVALSMGRLFLEELEQPRRAVEVLRLVRPDQRGEELRILLARALEQSGEAHAAMVEYVEVLDHTPTNAAAYRGVARLLGRQGHRELEWTAQALAATFSEPTDHERALLEQLDGAALPSGRVHLMAMPLPVEFQGLPPVFAQAGPYLAEQFPTHFLKLLPPEHPAHLSCQHLAACLGLSQVVVAQGGLVGAVAGLGQTPLVVLTASLCDHPGSAAFRFWVGRALATAACHSILAEGPGSSLGPTLLDALCQARPNNPETQALRKKLSRSLSWKARRQLVDAHRSLSVAEWNGYRQAEQQRADQVAAVICFNPRVTLQELARAEGLSEADFTASLRGGHLLRYMLSEAYGDQIKALWGADL
jgi:tetratricopeptide (TPR) repeat protein